MPRKRQKSYFKETIINSELDIDVDRLPLLKNKGVSRKRKAGRFTESQAPPTDPEPVDTCHEQPSSSKIQSEEQQSVQDTEGAQRNPENKYFVSTSQLDAKDKYILELSGNIVPLLNYRYFVMRDHTLKNKFLSLSRSAKDFSGTVSWAYTCSCDPQREQLLLSMENYVLDTSKEFQLKYPHCLHVEALSHVMEYFDNQQQAVPEIDSEHLYCSSVHTSEPSSDVFEIFDQECYCVRDESDIIIVTTVKGKPYCTKCNKWCSHCKKVQEAAEEGEISLPDYKAKPGKFSACCVSQEGIPLYPVSAELQQVLQKNTLERVPASGFQPAEDNCELCGCCLTCEEKSVPLFDKKLTYNVLVTTKKCACGQNYSVDGLAAAILNMDRYMVAYEVLLDFLDAFTLNRSSMWTYYQTLRESHKRCNDLAFPDCFKYNNFRESWYSFLALVMKQLDVASEFICSDCGTAPRTIIIDATSLGYRKWEHPLTSVPRQRKQACIPTVVPMVKDKTMRSRLKEYCSNQCSTEDLISQARECYPPIIPLLCKFRQRGQDTLPTAYKALFKSLASTSPACSIVPSNSTCFALIDHLVKGEPVFRDPSLVSTVQEQMPVFMDILSHFAIDLQELRPILQSLKDESFTFFEQNGTDQEETAAEESVDEDKYSFYPALGVVRRRGLYAADTVRYNASKTCTKKGKGHPTLSPGIFCLFCQHGICYGFTAMKSHESPDVPFTVLKSRFPIAPSVVVYDNACNLHRYCLRRAPAFFQNTSFLIDRLHWYNHRGCSEGYNLHIYNHLASLNSQAAEQANSSIGKLKSMLSYMNFNNFMVHCKFYLWNMNRREKTGILRN